MAFEDTPVVTDPDGRLALVGRATHEKGIAEAIAVAQRTGRPLVIAAKAYAADEIAFVEEVIRPAVAADIAEFIGEVTGPERDDLLRSSAATLMLGGWPEPFGLVAIESLALGTPVIGRRAGALPEIIEHGVDGFLVDDVNEAAFAVQRLAAPARQATARRPRGGFSPVRMAGPSQEAYGRVVGEARLGRFRAV